MTSLKISTVTRSENLDTQRVQVGIESRGGAFSQIIWAWTKQSITPDLKVINWNNHKKQWPHLNSIKFPNVLHHGSVDILIGVHAIDLHKTIEEVQGGPGEPIARRTPLGCTCVGSLEKNHPLKEHESLHHAQEYETLGALLRQFWELDSIGLADTDDRRSFTLMEKEAMQKVSNTRHKVNGRYEVGIPWISDRIDLENNKSLALQRLESLERSLRRQPLRCIKSWVLD